MRKLLVLAALLFVCASVFGVTQLQPLQGKAKLNGVCVTSGDLRAYLYTASTGGTLVYDSGSDFNGEIQSCFFGVMLGSGSQVLDLNYGQLYWLDLAVNNNDLDFNGSERKMFESSRGKDANIQILRSSSGVNALIVDVSGDVSVPGTFTAGTLQGNLNYSYIQSKPYIPSTAAWDANFAALGLYVPSTAAWDANFALRGAFDSNAVLDSRYLGLGGDLNWAQVNSVVPWADANVADDITLTNITQITNRSYADLQNLPSIPSDASIDANINDIFSLRMPIQDANIGNITGTKVMGIVNKLVQGTNITLSCTGNDSNGTCTINSTGGGSGVTYSEFRQFFDGNLNSWVGGGVADANVSNELTINTSQNAIFRNDLNALGGLNANTVRSFDNNALSLQTLNTTRMTIATDGRVGILDPTPDALLDVNYIGNNSGVAFRVDANTANSPVVGLGVDKNGNVGIGTVSPLSKLEILGSHNATAENLLTLRTTGTAIDTDTGIQFLESGTKVGGIRLIDETGGTRLTFDTYLNNNVLSIKAGDIGLRAINPTNNLDINLSSGLTAMKVMISGKNQNMIIVDATNQRVGIGKAPTTVLDVNGTFQASGLSTFTSTITVYGGSATSSATEQILNENTNFKFRVMNNTSVSTAGNTLVGSLLEGANYTESSSGNHPLIATVGILMPRPIAGAATVGDTAALYVQDGNDSTVVSGKNYQSWFDGTLDNRFDGNVVINADLNVQRIYLLGTTDENVGIGDLNVLGVNLKWLHFNSPVYFTSDDGKENVFCYYAKGSKGKTILVGSWDEVNEDTLEVTTKKQVNHPTCTKAETTKKEIQAWQKETENKIILQRALEKEINNCNAGDATIWRNSKCEYSFEKDLGSKKENCEIENGKWDEVNLTCDII